MSFAGLLQESEMVPHFLLMYAAAVVLSSFNNTCSHDLFSQKVFKQKKTACNSREFMWHLPPIYLQLAIYLQNLLLDLCLSGVPNLHQKNL